MTDICLEFLCAPELEEQLLDQLLMSDQVSTFTSQRIARHGTPLNQLDAAEQVLGREQSVLITLRMEARAAEQLLDELRDSFAGTGLKYWTLPVLSQGQL